MKISKEEVIKKIASAIIDTLREVGPTNDEFDDAISCVLSACCTVMNTSFDVAGFDNPTDKVIDALKSAVDQIEKGGKK